MKGRLTLVTGACGFVGRHLVEELTAQGARVRCLARRTSRYEALRDTGAEIAFGSLEDVRGLKAAVKGCDTVFHAAGKTKVLSEDAYYRANAEGTARVLEAIEAAAPDALLVHVSSLAASGPSAKDRPLSEEDPCRPVSAYGRSKLAGEQAVRGSRTRWVIVRPPPVYGPRDRDVFSLFRLASLGISPRVGQEPRTMSLIHARDLARGLVLAVEARPGSTYFLADPTPYPLDRIMGDIAACLGVRLRGVSVPLWAAAAAAAVSEAGCRLARRPAIFSRDKAREMAHPHWTCSAAKAQRELAFSIAYPLAEGVAQTAAWYKSQGWL